VRTLLIDDERKIKATVVARTFDQGISALMKDGPFDLLYLDHDLGEKDPKKTGYGIVNFLEANPQFLPKEIKLVTSNPVGRQQMQVVIEKLYERKENESD
jgi:hypothetical protein